MFFLYAIGNSLNIFQFIVKYEPQMCDERSWKQILAVEVVVNSTLSETACKFHPITAQHLRLGRGLVSPGLYYIVDYI